MTVLEPFPVIAVSENAPETIEQMGSKKKFWFKDETLGRCLYKVARPNTGEDWAEKVAEQMAELLGLPHAQYEMASWYDPRAQQNTSGVLSPTVVPPGGRLTSGNELLVAQTRGYPRDAPNYGLSQYTVEAALALLETTRADLPPAWEAPDGVAAPVDLFVGYLLLDAWIGNTDRHHENWAIIEMGGARADCAATRYLAPTFDHASCLGRNESDVKREKRLRTGDPGYSVAAYAAKARSALYASQGDEQPLTVSDAFRLATKTRPIPARAWRERLARVNENQTEAVFARVPSDRLTPVASEFAQKMLHLNRQTLLNV